tara:strand:- start:1416 stop:2009 length:594 start_codon:yes stop_codon:yes gene_type:complete
MKFLFDLGGVFFNWDPVYFYEKIFNNKEELNYFLEEICNDEWNLKQDSGRSIKEAEIELINKYPDYEEKIYMYYANHRKMLKNTYEDSIDILFELKNIGYECFVLSNWSAETFEGMMEEYSFLKKFDGLVISGEERIAKPNKQIYEIAIKRFNLQTNKTIFIDDKLDNIKAAIKLGFLTIHLTNPYEIKKEINKFLI